MALLSACSGLAGLWWTADELVRPPAELHEVLGVGFGALGLIVGTTALAVSWLGYQADRREHAGGLPIDGLAADLALAVRGQWKAEARLRRLNDPLPAPGRRRRRHPERRPLEPRPRRQPGTHRTVPRVCWSPSGPQKCSRAASDLL